MLIQKVSSFIHLRGLDNAGPAELTAAGLVHIIQQGGSPFAGNHSVISKQVWWPQGK